MANGGVWLQSLLLTAAKSFLLCIAVTIAKYDVSLVLEVSKPTRVEYGKGFSVGMQRHLAIYQCFDLSGNQDLLFLQTLHLSIIVEFDEAASKVSVTQTVTHASPRKCYNTLGSFTDV